MISHSLLLIDDDDDTISLVKFILESDTDWQIFTASSGKEGIAKARAERPELILLDIAIPEIDGLNVYKSLKSDPTTSSIPIMLITAMVGIEEIVKSRITENVEVITKPFDILELSNRIDRVFESSMVRSN